MKKYWGLILILLSINCITQSVKDIEEQKRKLIQEIENTNSLINKNSNSIDVNIKNIKLIDRDISLRNKLISNIEKEIDIQEDTLQIRKKSIRNSKASLNELKINYSEAVNKQCLINRGTSPVMYVLAGRNISEIYRRFRYLKEFNTFRRNQYKAIETYIRILSEENIVLQNEIEQSKKLKLSKESEVAGLNKSKNNKNALISKLKIDNKKLNSKIEANKKKIDELNLFIKKLLEEERKKKEKNGIYTLSQEEIALSKSFNGNIGKMPWPVNKGVITSHFGINKDAINGKVELLSNGVDIETAPGTDVKAVFDGKITYIFSAPGYNQGLIIRHGEYLTFYANLEEVDVKKGDTVSTGQVIGKCFKESGASSSSLHFEIWKENGSGMPVKQNPENWLRK